jgi:hypothetical protein
MCCWSVGYVSDWVVVSRYWMGPFGWDCRGSPRGSIAEQLHSPRGEGWPGQRAWSNQSYCSRSGSFLYLSGVGFFSGLARFNLGIPNDCELDPPGGRPENSTPGLSMGHVLASSRSQAPPRLTPRTLFTNAFPPFSQKLLLPFLSLPRRYSQSKNTPTIVRA